MYISIHIYTMYMHETMRHLLYTDIYVSVYASKDVCVLGSLYRCTYERMDV